MSPPADRGSPGPELDHLVRHDGSKQSLATAMATLLLTAALSPRVFTVLRYAHARHKLEDLEKLSTRAPSICFLAVASLARLYDGGDQLLQDVDTPGLMPGAAAG